jgi:hypothetical protein
MKIMPAGLPGCARYRIPAHADSPRPDAGGLKPDPTSVWAVLTGQCGSPIISARVTAGESALMVAGAPTRQPRN